MDKICPFVKANSNENAIMGYGWYKCIKEECVWWSEDAQKCAVLVIAESQRKAVKGK